MNPSDRIATEREREISRVPIQCPSCGKTDVGTSMTIDNFIYGEGADAAELSVEVPLRTCTACGFQFLDSEAEDAHHEAVCHHLGVMTPTEIRTLREEQGLSRAAFAQLTKLGEATIARWERGSLIQNGAYDQFLYLLGYEENLERLQERLASLGGQPVPALRRPTRPKLRVLRLDPALYAQQESFSLISPSSRVA